MPHPVLQGLNGLRISEKQPISIEIKMADGIFIKSMLIQKAGTLVPQHAHVYDHVSMLATGEVGVWADDEFVGNFIAPKGIPIPANVKHRFVSLVDDTLIYCIHNISRAGEVEIAEAHEIVKGPAE